MQQSLKKKVQVQFNIEQPGAKGSKGGGSPSMIRAKRELSNSGAKTTKHAQNNKVGAEVLQNIEEGEKVPQNMILKTYGFENFLPKGKHFFYFIRRGKFFCLSKKYPIVRFK
jgi:hypothetical protein